jgi:dTDP-4-amino-4,6-dideoxygalactose transaminase
VIEDACQAHGAAYRGRPVGSLGDAACFSFYPGKNLGAYGEGGMVVTDKPAIADRIRMLRDWGQSSRHHHDVVGFNYRMDGIQGAILRVKLNYLERWTEARRANADTYTRLLAGTNVSTPVGVPDVRHVYHIYAVRSAFRDELSQSLLQAGVQTGLHYPIPVHLQQAYLDPRYRRGDFPHSERAASEVLSLPMYPELTHSQIEFICERIVGLSAAKPSKAAGTTA